LELIIKKGAFCRNRFEFLQWAILTFPYGIEVAHESRKNGILSSDGFFAEP